MSGVRRKNMKTAGKTPRDQIEKVCNQCLTLKPVEFFEANQSRKDGSTIYRPTCIDCKSGIDGVKNHNKRKRRVRFQTDTLPWLAGDSPFPFLLQELLGGVDGIVQAYFR